MNDNSVLPYSRQALRTGRYLSRQFVIVSGAGCGKTTLADKIAEAFIPKLKRVSAGWLMRERAASLGMTIEEFAAHMKEHPEEGHDRWCDKQIAVYSLQDNVVIDCHLPSFAPYGFIIYLTCSLHVRAERRARPGQGVALVTAALEGRDRNDMAKYARIYPGSIWLETDYDLVINTETHDEDQTFKIAMFEHSNWLDRNRHNLIQDDVMPREQLAVC